MATTTKILVNFYIDYPGAVTQKFSEEVEESQLSGLGAKGRIWRNRIMNEQSDLVFPYAWLFFSRPSDEYGYSISDLALGFVKRLEPSDLYHAKDVRMTSTYTEETNIFGSWEV